MTRDEIQALARELDEVELPTAEFDRRLREALADPAEREARIELIDWFCRRYPTPLERLAYARRKARELAASPLGK